MDLSLLIENDVGALVHQRRILQAGPLLIFAWQHIVSATRMVIGKIVHLQNGYHLP
jgi:hypothetical protein